MMRTNCMYEYLFVGLVASLIGSLVDESLVVPYSWKQLNEVKQVQERRKNAYSKPKAKTHL